MTPDYTLSSLTQPSGPKRMSRRLVAVLVGIGVFVVVGVGVGVAFAVSSQTAASPRAAALSPSPSWSSVFGDQSTASTAPMIVVDDAAQAVCDAVHAAGADGVYDPATMLHVVALGVGAHDPAIVSPLKELATAATAAHAAPKDLKAVLGMATAGINLQTACVETRYVAP